MIFSKQLTIIATLLLLAHTLLALECVKVSSNDVESIKWKYVGELESSRSTDGQQSYYSIEVPYHWKEGIFFKETRHGSIEYTSTVWRKWATGQMQKRALTIDSFRTSGHLDDETVRIEYQMREWTHMANVSYWLDNYSTCELNGSGEDGRQKVPFYADDVKAVNLYLKT